MAPARNFESLVDLIRKAEDALIKNAGQTDPIDRASTLRGIYYGTEWSLDYKVENKRSELGARIRNIGFVTYTGGNLPADPRPALGSSLFDDLQKSQSIHQESLGLDIGHVLIGLETRASTVMRNVPLPGQGGTGLEIVTWLGDLGGGAASLAKSRVTRPTTSVEIIFHNTSSDYGVMDNLEGDVGGYLVASGTNPGGEQVFSSGKGIADVITDYLPLSSDIQWNSRAARFSIALGATISPNGITNPKDLIDNITEKIYNFAVWYMATRWIPSGELIGKNTITACSHMKGTSREIATMFVNTLSNAIVHPHNAIQASSPYPNPTSPIPCESDLLNAASTDVSAIRKSLGELREEFRKLFE